MRHFIVMCDSNDADYITNIVSVEDDVVEKFMPIIEAIENYMPYPNGFDIDYHNWDSMRSDLRDEYGMLNCFEKYPQFSKEYIDEFFDTFLIGCTPEWACGPEMVNSIHTVHKIQEITLGKELVYADHKKLKARAESNPKNIEYTKRKNELSNYKNDKGISLCSIKFDEMTPEETKMIEEYSNLWRKYQ